MERRGEGTEGRGRKRRVGEGRGKKGGGRRNNLACGTEDLISRLLWTARELDYRCPKLGEEAMVERSVLRAEVCECVRRCVRAYECVWGVHACAQGRVSSRLLQRFLCGRR